ncbi:MAG: type I-E CRISPR-associated protein Cas5/CasD [Candidatus Helarchaeota archaeon]
MHTLLLRFSGPMQSYGTDSKFNIRNSAQFPTKTAVLGLICSALGITREKDISHLAQLRMGIRIDSEGVMQNDFQIARNVYPAHGGKKATEISTRYFLSDAEFLVGLEAEDEKILSYIQEGLKNPEFQIFLGRKSHVPSKPVWLKDGLKKNTPLETALTEYPLLKRLTSRKTRRESLEQDSSDDQEEQDSSIPSPDQENEKHFIILETGFSDAEQLLYDQPIEGSFKKRIFGQRGIKIIEKKIDNVKYVHSNEFV